MITRPLDLNARLRPPPRSFDWVFFVNIALIAMFFLFFGSRFVLTPAVVVSNDDFRPIVRPADQISYVSGTVVVNIKANGQIFTDTGLINTMPQLRGWLQERLKKAPDASLILQADASVSLDEITRISALAYDVEFKQVSILVAPERPNAGEGRRGVRAP